MAEELETVDEDGCLSRSLALCGFGGPSEPHRTVLLQPTEAERNELNFGDNAVYTYKYNIVTYVPRSLFEQFRRLANVYFLVISVLMVLGTYTTLFDSPLTPFSTVIPLIFVLLVTMVKEGIEDIGRHRADHEVNNREVQILTDGGSGSTTTKRWIDVDVGDFLVIHDREEIAADVVILATSDPADVCYVETSNIDGETNLKSRKCAPTGDNGVGSRFQTLESLANIRGVCECEHPSADIHHFQGNVTLNDRPGDQVSVDAANLMLRGSTMRNTRWACGVVVYTGGETKIVMNSSDPPSKLSKMESITNTMVWIILFAQSVLSAISTVAFVIWQSLFEDDAWYLCESGKDAPLALFVDNCDNASDPHEIGQFFTFIILYNNFIPISLYVTIELVLATQALFLDWDLDMYHEETDTPALCRNSAACADLGMIEYIFSDKTGTLTRNVMEFRRCSVASRLYGAPPENEEAADLPEDIAAAKPTAPWVETDEMVTAARSDDRSAEYEFLLIMAAAHTVVLEKDDDGKEALQAESPDEEALVRGAGDLGVRFRGRRGTTILVDSFGEERQYELLATIPFNSTRKRMSVIVRTPDGRIMIMCKGADSVLLDPEGDQEARVAGFMSGHTEELLLKHLDVFAADGLRTLVLAKREMTSSEYDKWAKLWHEASVSVTSREDLQAEAAAQVEQKLLVVGATAIEDKLQEGVPSCIADLAEAGVKLWVLTGDKMETAINIGFSARLLNSDMSIIKLKHDKDGGAAATKAKLKRLIAHFTQLTRRRTGVWRRVRNGISDGVAAIRGRGESRGEADEPPRTGEADVEEEEKGEGEQEPMLNLNSMSSDYLALVVDGPSLSIIFRDFELQYGFLDLACLCKVVVACRVSPAQKADIVRLVQRGVHPKPITLAIGDGANDVGMIQAAQVGVGISGKEGRQAVNASDFAIAQFRFLRSLTLVHGRWNYRRLAKTILYSFYKNIVLTFILFYYQFLTGFSGHSIFESYVYAGYNFFLGLPPLVLGLFDKDVEKRTVLELKFLYFVGRDNVDMNPWATVRWIIEAIWISLIIFLLSFGIYFFPDNVWGGDGEAEGVWVYGTTVYSALLFSMLLSAAAITYTWNYWIVGSFVFSIGLWFFFLAVYTLMIDLSPDFYYVAYQMLELGIFWMIMLLIPTTTLMSELAVALFKHEFMATVLDHAIEYDRGYGLGAGKSEAAVADGRRGLDAERRAALIAGEAKGEDADAQAQRPSGKFRVDRDHLREINDTLTEEEKAEMGFHRGGSSYNFDFVTDSYGVGGGDHPKDA